MYAGYIAKITNMWNLIIKSVNTNVKLISIEMTKLEFFFLIFLNNRYSLMKMILHTVSFLV